MPTATATERLIRPYADEYAHWRDKRIAAQAQETASMKRLSEVMAFHHLDKANCGDGVEVLPDVTRKLKVVIPKSQVVNDEDESAGQTTTDTYDTTCPLCDAPDFGDCSCDRTEVFAKLTELGRVATQDMPEQAEAE